MNDDDNRTDAHRDSSATRPNSIRRANLPTSMIRWAASPSLFVLGLCILVGFAAPRLRASQPAVSYRLLGDGSSRMLSAPIARFVREIELMSLAKSPHRAVPSTNSSDVAEAELSDLKLALSALGQPAQAIERIVSAHAAERELIRSAIPAGITPPPFWSGAPAPVAAVPILSTAAVHVVDGLPAEFADYFRGAIAWHGCATNAAIAAWQSLLKRPESHRRFRST